MAKQIPEALKNALEDVGETVGSATWDCHGTLVVLHKALEKIAAKKGIIFDAPVHLLTNPANKEVVIQVTARLGDRQEWSIGEVSEKNCRNDYPFAMAEKRAKDRVILKLLGVAGDTYSEEEADKFNQERGETLGYMELVREHFDWIMYAKEAIANEDWTRLAAIWGDITHDQMAKLFKAPTKGGIFTTEERSACKGNDAFNKARKELANG